MNLLLTKYPNYSVRRVAPVSVRNVCLLSADNFSLNRHKILTIFSLYRVHSEDREELRSLLQRIQQLNGENNHNESKRISNHCEHMIHCLSLLLQVLAQWNVPIVLRFRCLLDNTCGFIVRLQLHDIINKLNSSVLNCAVGC
jgi:hypothetical protein